MGSAVKQKVLRRTVLGLGGLVALLGLQLYEPPPELMAGSAQRETSGFDGSRGQAGVRNEW